MSAVHRNDPENPVVICYDGSNEADEAIAYAGSLLRGGSALVVSAWKEILEEALSTGMTRPVADLVEANEREHRAAERFAERGARLAGQAGFDARPLVVKAERTVWEAIELTAEEHRAKLIVCGNGRSGIKAALPGNLASALVNHASRPLLVVPSTRAADQRVRDVMEHRSPVAR